MAGKTFLRVAAGAALVLLARPVVAHPLQVAAAAPAPDQLEPAAVVVHTRHNVVVDPPQDIVPTVTYIDNISEDELQALVQSVEALAPRRSDDDDDDLLELPEHEHAGASGPSVDEQQQQQLEDAIVRVPRMSADERERLAARQDSNGGGIGTEGALLTYISGEILPGPGSKEAGCSDFEILGPFTRIHPLMGSSNLRGWRSTAYGGRTAEVVAGETTVDPGEFVFAAHERITKFTVMRLPRNLGVAGFRFETTTNRTYEARADRLSAVEPLLLDLDVGDGLIGRVRGTSCRSPRGYLGSFGIDFVDELDSITVSNIAYEGFTNNIMPAGPGTLVSVGSQVCDNRNGSERQTITLTTTDAITRQTTITMQSSDDLGGRISVSAKVTIPLVAEVTTTGEFNWATSSYTNTADMNNSITTRAATFALLCPAGKLCTANAFFTQFKLDVKINATLTATSKSGGTFDWTQTGRYQGADSLAMQFNVTEVATPPRPA